MSESNPATHLSTPFQQLGGREMVLKITQHFYAAMARDEKALAELHELDTEGRVSERTQARFAEFFCEWLGGPPHYSQANGHPRLRMRHGHVPINSEMRDAWMRAMRTAFDELHISGDARQFVDERLLHVADFLRNQPD